MKSIFPFNKYIAGSAPLIQSFHKRALLALMIVMMFGGLFPVISQTSRFTLWGIWILIWWLSLRCIRSNSLNVFGSPAVPLVIWFTAYGLFGAIASPEPVFFDLIRDFFRLITILVGLSVILEDRESCIRLGNYTTWVLVLNLAVSLALKNNPTLLSFMFDMDYSHADIQVSTDRFSGLWGNANVAGMNTLILLVFSLWGTGKIIWLGRLAGVWMIYLTASRTATYLLIPVVCSITYYILRYVLRFRTATIVAVLCAVIMLLLTSVPDLSNIIPKDSMFQRVLDITESKTNLKNEDRRIDVLFKWLEVAKDAPWYGYGYGAMRGGGHMGIVYRTDILHIGSHNTYVGTYLDAGLFGTATFLAMLIVGIKRAVLAKHITPLGKYSLLALGLITIVFSALSHNMINDMDGQGLYLLFFLLPQARAFLQ